MRRVTNIVLACVITCGAGACAQVVGTSDLEPCEGEAECGTGGGGGSSGTESSTADATSTGSSGSNGSSVSSSASSGSGDTSSSSGGSCFFVTLTYEGITGEGRVRIDVSPDDVDFDEGESRHCLPPGEKTIELECRTEIDDRDDYPLVVSWGNERCPDGAACTFQLDADQTFDLTGACD